MLKPLIESANNHPKLTAWAGAAFGWITVDLLRSAQIFAAGMAGLASFCAVVITAPKAIAEIRSWPAKIRAMWWGQ